MQMPSIAIEVPLSLQFDLVPIGSLKNERVSKKRVSVWKFLNSSIDFSIATRTTIERFLFEIISLNTRISCNRKLLAVGQSVLVWHLFLEKIEHCLSIYTSAVLKMRHGRRQKDWTNQITN
jgi:hypothetical protein